MKTLVFDRVRYARVQLVDALTCPINRHATRLHHNCDDWFLHQHPDLLLMHYIKNGGAVAFARRREEFLQEVEIPDPVDETHDHYQI